MTNPMTTRNTRNVPSNGVWDWDWFMEMLVSWVGTGLEERELDGRRVRTRAGVIGRHGRNGLGRTRTEGCGAIVDRLGRKGMIVARVSASSDRLGRCHQAAAD